MHARAFEQEGVLPFFAAPDKLLPRRLGGLLNKGEEKANRFRCEILGGGRLRASTSRFSVNISG